MLIQALVFSVILTLPPPLLDVPRETPIHHAAVVAGGRKDTPKTKRQRIDRRQAAAGGEQILLPGIQGSAHDFGSCKLHPAPGFGGSDRGND